MQLFYNYLIDKKEYAYIITSMGQASLYENDATFAGGYEW